MKSESESRSVSEVRSYVRKLVALIVVGVILMTSAAVWAWNVYGKRLETAPPLPEGAPPVKGEPAE